ILKEELFMELTYEKIVIAVDGSKAAEKEFNKSIEVAKRIDAILILAHVVDTRTFSTAVAYVRSLFERAENYAKYILDEYEQTAKDAGVVNTKTVMKYGSPKVAIAKEIAPEEEADLIIVGATGLYAVERILIGSVSESIVRYSK